MRSLSKYPTSLSGPCHHILPLDGEADRPLIVFFGAKDLDEGAFNFFQVGRELEAHRFFFNNGENHWYQYGIPGFGDSPEAVVIQLLLWKEALGASKIYMVGTSMGGYGAIHYGCLLNAGILAFSTDAVLQRSPSQSRRFFTGTKPATCPDLRALVAKHKPDLTLVVGERDVPDLYSAWELCRTASVRAISMIGAGHIMPSFLSRQARLGPMLRQLIKGQKISYNVGSGSALTAEGYAKKSFAALRAARKKGPDWSAVEQHAREALQTYPNGEAAQVLLGEALLRQDRHAEAVPVLSQALVGQTEDIDTLLLLSLVLRRTQGIERAKAICHGILDKRPGYAKALVALALTYVADQNLEAARTYIMKAVRIQPDNATFRKHLERIEGKLLAAKTAAKPAVKTAAKPAVKTAAKPAVKPAAKPAAEPVAKPAAEPAAKPAAEPVAKPAAEPAAKPAAEPVAKPAAEPAAKPAAEPAAKLAAEPAAKPETEPVANPAAEPAAKPETKRVTKPRSRATAKSTTKAAPKPQTRARAKSAAKTRAKPRSRTTTTKDPDGS